jgi:hypothetical protein
LFLALGRELRPEKLEVSESLPCRHTLLVPQWDSVEAMGDKSRATHFICNACHRSYTPEETRMLRSAI